MLKHESFFGMLTALGCVALLGLTNIAPALAQTTDNSEDSQFSGSFYDPENALPDAPETAISRMFDQEKREIIEQLEEKQASKGMRGESWEYTKHLPPIEKQERPYWCGPAAVSTMIRGFTNNPNATNQTTVALGLKTTTHGTNTANIAPYLNRNYASYGHWGFYVPSNYNNLGNMMRASIRARNSQAIVMNVKQLELRYWRINWPKTANKGHYVLGIGVTSSNSAMRIGEVYNGGMYNAVMRECYNAVRLSPSGGIIG